MTRVQDLTIQFEAQRAASDFSVYVRYLASAKDAYQALQIAETRGANERVITVLKAAVAAGTTSAPAWAGNLKPYKIMSGAFLDSLAGRGFFDSIYPAFLPVPMSESVAISTAGIEGAEVGEFVPAPISALQFGLGEMQPRRVEAVIVMSRELINSVSTAGQRLIDIELRKAATRATDRAFFGVILDGLTPLASIGNRAFEARQDLTAILTAIAGDAESNYAFAMNGDLAKALAGLATDDGAAAFPEMTPTGGRLLGVPAYVAELAAGRVVALDASQIAADRSEIVADIATDASLQMSTTPSGGAAALLSLWQSNAAALRVLRWIGVERLRANAVAVLDGAEWGTEESS
ncbi:phage major capsid protein [Mesorhizobium sp. M0187]|uniref:phage major capsid protein n=1 Tax=Mesorhizobium sp. M0187 TaxID=2956908 RepID=UPI00333560ED